MKVLLINPPIREWSKPNCFPLGLGYIAACLLEEGHEVEVLDINAHRFKREEVEKKISQVRADIIGIGGLVTVYRYMKWLVNITRKYHPETKIVIGGSVASSIPDIMLGKNAVDILCIGEGEETVKELVRALENKETLSGVKGIWYKDPSGRINKTPARPPIKDLDSIPLPAWELFPMEIYLKNPVGAPNRNKWIDGSAGESGTLSMNIFGTRGCPYNCIYCYHDFMGHVYRQRSPENIVREMEVLYRKYRVPYFHFIDDEFVMNREFIYEFCRLVKDLSARTGEQITWGCTGRVNLMTEEMVAVMAGAGCALLGYGIESGSQKMLDFIKKRVTVEQAKNAVKLTKKYLGWVGCSFMIGYPGETRKTIQDTVDFCKELGITPEVIFFLTPYPGTELFRMAVEQGKIGDVEKYVLGLGEQGEKVRVNFTQFSDQELFSIQESMIRELNAWNKVKHAEAR